MSASSNSTDYPLESAGPLSADDGDDSWDAEVSSDAAGADQTTPEDLVGAASTLVNQQWSRELAKRPLLSRQEEIDLARRVQAGDQEAREKFIESNLKLVVSIAKRYRWSGVPMEDLIQEGNMGLVKAVDKFNPDRGCRFSTHAVMWIEGQIRRSIGKLRHNVHLPLRVIADLNKVSRVVDELTQELRQQPTAAEVAEKMKASVEYVEQLLAIRTDPVSLDDSVDDELHTFLHEVLEDEQAVFPDDFALRREGQRQVREALASLPSRYQTVLTLRYGLDGGGEHTLEEIGQKLNLTRQRVRQIELTALKKMQCLDCPRLRPLPPKNVVA